MSALRRMGTSAVVTLCLVTLIGCAAPQDPSYVKYISSQPESVAAESPHTIWIDLPDEPNFSVLGHMTSGYIGTDTPQMLYPAPDVVSGVAAVLTHAVIVDAQKDAKRKEAYERANVVAEPYTPYFSSYSVKEWTESGVNAIDATIPSTTVQMTQDAQTNAGPILKFMPVFYVYQDQKTLIIKNSVSVFGSRDATDAVYQNLIEVVSGNAHGESASYWLEGDGRNLSLVAQQLFQHSLELAVKDYLSLFNGQAKEKTFKIKRLNQLSYERGVSLEQTCDRIIIRTLRGWLRSIPINSMMNPGGHSTTCTPA